MFKRNHPCKISVASLGSFDLLNFLFFRSVLFFSSSSSLLWFLCAFGSLPTCSSGSFPSKKISNCLPTELPVVPLIDFVSVFFSLLSMTSESLLELFLSPVFFLFTKSNELNFNNIYINICLF